MLQASFAKLKLETTLMDLPNELIERILVMTFYARCGIPIICLDFKFVVALTRINKRCSRILHNTWDYRDLKVLCRAALDVKAEGEFYPKYCVLTANRYVPKKMVKLASALSKHHPVLFEIETIWSERSASMFIEQFSRFVLNAQKSLAIAGIEIKPANRPWGYDDYDDFDQDIKDISIFDDLVKLLKKVSTVGEDFYLRVESDDDELCDDQYREYGGYDSNFDD